MAQTQTEIRQMLEESGLKPQKMFGQNFLVDHNLLRAVVELSGVSAGDTVLEVGPGTGTLTDALLEAGANVLAVEIDHGLARLLAARYAAQPRVRLMRADVLAGKHRINPDVLAAAGEMSPAGVHLVSNLPYNIATPLICDCLLQSLAAARGRPGAVRFIRLTVTIQREVAGRLMAGADDEAYGPASVLVALLANVEAGKKLPATAFWPPPNVVSQMIRIDPVAPPPDVLGDPAVLRQLVNWAFSHRRKKIISTGRRTGAPFRPEAIEAALAAADVDPDSRPERITPRQFARMAAELANRP
jgi:16S rRNA (adenine1518-N6/adenine1519-N6)-dimethyltransferase